MARKKKKSKGSKRLFILEIIVLLIFIGGLFLYGQINMKLDKIATPETATFVKQEVEVNEEAPVEELKGYTNIALFALDKRSRTESAGGENSDTIIICSINNDTKEVKLVSVYRDTLLDIGDNNYQKCNAAYAYGGPQQALSMLNTNMDLDIENYVTVDFRAMVRAIDMLGGLDIPLTYQEMVHMNNYCVETSEETETEYTPLELPEPKPEDETKILGTYHLNGVQATSYCRIRYTSSLDMGRTERQRFVISLIVEKAKKSSIATLSKIMDEVFPYVETSFSKGEIVKMALGMLSYQITDTTGFPECYRLADLQTQGSIIAPATLETNVHALHCFLFEAYDYTASDALHKKSQKIIAMTGYGVDGELVESDELQSLIQELGNENSFEGQAVNSEEDYSAQVDWNADNSTTNNTYTEPSYTTPAYTYTEPSYTTPDYSYTEPTYTEPTYTEPTYTEPTYTEPTYTEPTYTEPDFGDQYAVSEPGSPVDFSAETGMSDAIPSPVQE